MNTRTIHLLVGEPSLLKPKLIDGQVLADMCGPNLHCVDAFWVSARCGVYSHSFLVDDISSNRIEIFAQTIVANYVRGPQPFLIIPDLILCPNNIAMALEKSDWIQVLARMQKSINDFGCDCNFYLHLLTLPLQTESTMRLEVLKNCLSKEELNIIGGNVTITSRSPQTAPLEMNYLSTNLIASIKDNLTRYGILLTDTGELSHFILRKLETMAKIGMEPTLPVNDELLERLTESIMTEIITCKAL